ncbi:MAG: NUDIX hydrolase, partial [Actinophytocola sp.]
MVLGLWLAATANRLDRLHVRTDAAWAALDAALARRAVVA